MKTLTLLFLESSLGFFSQWFFEVLPLLPIHHCWLCISKTLFHVTGTPPFLLRSSWASIRCEFFPECFSLFSFARSLVFVSCCSAASATDLRDRLLFLACYFSDLFYLILLLHIWSMCHYNLLLSRLPRDLAVQPPWHQDTTIQKVMFRRIFI